MRRELFAYNIVVSGLCDDGRIASFNLTLPMAYLDKVDRPWRYLLHEFARAQKTLTEYHDDLIVHKLKWAVDGVWRTIIDRQDYREIARARLTNEPLTAGELARLP